jgi:hypothetical protein
MTISGLVGLRRIAAEMARTILNRLRRILKHLHTTEDLQRYSDDIDDLTPASVFAWRWSRDRREAFALKLARQAIAEHRYPTLEGDSDLGPLGFIVHRASMPTNTAATYDRICKLYGWRSSASGC